MSNAYTLIHGKVEPTYGVNKERAEMKKVKSCHSGRKLGSIASFWYSLNLPKACSSKKIER